MGENRLEKIDVGINRLCQQISAPLEELERPLTKEGHLDRGTLEKEGPLDRGTLKKEGPLDRGTLDKRSS